MIRFFTVSFIFTLLLAVSLFAYSVYYFTAPGPLASEKNVMIESGTGFTGIAAQLKAEGVVEHPLLFKSMVALNGAAGQFKAGEYAFPARITPKQVMDMLVKGEVMVHSITIPEGWTVTQIVDLLSQDARLTGDIAANIPEGSLLPNTYHINRGDSRDSVVTRMREAMEEALAKAWAERADALPLQNPQEALILASIVEKETGVDGERAHVASVFINRLNIGMKLQSDPTTIYGIEIVSGPMERALTRKDLQKPTPYNTYTIDRLPPTPIANPGLDAIKATLNPLKTKDFYFVATGTGGHHFARTLQEHNANVAKYRAIIRQNSR